MSCAILLTFETCLICFCIFNHLFEILESWDWESRNQNEKSGFFWEKFRTTLPHGGPSDLSRFFTRGAFFLRQLAKIVYLSILVHKQLYRRQLFLENVIFGIKCLLRKLQTSYTLKNRLPKTSIPDLRPGVLFSWYVNRWTPTTRPVGIEASRDFHPNQTSDSIQVLYLGNLTKKRRTCFSFVYWFKEPFPEKV